MTKELQALANVKREAGFPFFSTFYDSDMWKEDWKTVRKGLEALEILKVKKVNLEYVKCCDTYEQYKTICSYWSEISKEEFELLKEVLNND